MFEYISGFLMLVHLLAKLKLSLSKHETENDMINNLIHEIESFRKGYEEYCEIDPSVDVDFPEITKRFNLDESKALSFEISRLLSALTNSIYFANRAEMRGKKKMSEKVIQNFYKNIYLCSTIINEYVEALSGHLEDSEFNELSSIKDSLRQKNDLMEAPLPDGVTPVLSDADINLKIDEYLDSFNRSEISLSELRKKIETLQTTRRATNWKKFYK